MFLRKKSNYIILYTFSIFLKYINLYFFGSYIELLL